MSAPPYRDIGMVVRVRAVDLPDHALKGRHVADSVREKAEQVMCKAGVFLAGRGVVLANVLNFEPTPGMWPDEDLADYRRFKGDAEVAECWAVGLQYQDRVALAGELERFCPSVAATLRRIAPGWGGPIIVVVDDGSVFLDAPEGTSRVMEIRS